MSKFYQILIGIAVVVLTMFLFVRYTTQELNEKINVLEKTLQQERDASKKQIALEKNTANYYKDQYNKFIKDGDYCYNHTVEEDVLKMIGE